MEFKIQSLHEISPSVRRIGGVPERSDGGVVKFKILDEISPPSSSKEGWLSPLLNFLLYYEI